MGNPTGHERDDTLDVIGTVTSSTYSIGVGDQVMQDAEGGVQQVSAAGWTDEVTARKNAAARFAGVALDGSPATCNTDIRVGTAGVYEFTCTSTTYEVGDYFGPEKSASGNYLDPDLLQKVTDPAEATCYAVNRAASAATTVKVRLLPRAFAPAGRIGEIWFGPFSMASGHRSSAAGLFLSNFAFGRRVRILQALGYHADGTLSSNYGVVFQKNASNVMVSLSFAVDAAMPIPRSCQWSLESSAADFFDAGDLLVIHGEGPVGAGVDRIAVGLRFLELGG